MCHFCEWSLTSPRQASGTRSGSDAAIKAISQSCSPRVSPFSSRGLPTVSLISRASSVLQAQCKQILLRTGNRSFHLDGDWLQLGDKPIPEPIMWPKSSSALIGQARFT